MSLVRSKNELSQSMISMSYKSSTINLTTKHYQACIIESMPKSLYSAIFTFVEASRSLAVMARRKMTQKIQIEGSFSRDSFLTFTFSFASSFVLSLEHSSKVSEARVDLHLQ